MRDPYISYKNILSIAWPVMLGSLGQTLIYVVDNSFIGRIGVPEMGASAIGGIFYFVMFMIGHAMNNGMQVMVARRNGEGNHREIGAIIDHELRLIIPLALVQFVLMHFLIQDLLPLITRKDEVLDKTFIFLHYRSYGIFFCLLNSLFMAFFTGIGHTKVTYYTTGVMVTVNVLMLFLLVFGNWGFPAMGIGGAGLASSIAEGTVSLVFITIIFRKKFKKEFYLFEFLKVRYQLFSSMLRLSAPLVFQQVISMGSWWLFFIALKQLGEMPLAISNAVRGVYFLFGVPVWALASTSSSMTSNIIGQGKPSEVIHLIKRVMMIGLVFACSFVLFMNLFPSFFISVYTNVSEVIAGSFITIHTLTLPILLFSIALPTIFAVSGTGATRVSMYIEIICIVCYLLYVYFTAVRSPCPLPIIWLAEALYWLIALTLCLIYIRSNKWRTVTV